MIKIFSIFLDTRPFFEKKCIFAPYGVLAAPYGVLAAPYSMLAAPYGVSAAPYGVLALQDTHGTSNFMV